MAKFSVAYVKQHPVMFGAIFLVFGLLLWMLLSRGAHSSSPSVSGSAPGPSDAQLSAEVALQQSQIGGQTQVALGQLSLSANQNNNDTQIALGGLALQAQLAQIQADHNLSNAQIEASMGALTLQLGHDLAITHDNNQFMLDYAKNAQDAATTQLMVGADLQKTLSADQLKGYTIQTLASQIPNLSLKRGERNQAFDVLTNAVTGSNQPVASLHSGGITGIGGFLASIAPVALMLV